MPFVPKEYGGMGLGPLANALVQMELGQSLLGALSMNSQGPDDATMLTLLAHGTDYQKEKFLKPLLNGEKRICFSMTEKAAGADATGMQTTRGQGRQRELRAQRREVVLLVRQRRGPGAGHGQDRSGRAAPPAVLDLHRRAAEPGLQHQAQRPDHGGRRPADDASMAATPRSRSRTWWSRPRTCWAARATASTWASTASPTAACATACTTSPRPSARSTWPSPRHQARDLRRALADRQAVQFMLADCATQLYIARLMLLHIAYKAEKGMDMRQENSIAKVSSRTWCTT